MRMYSASLGNGEGYGHLFLHLTLLNLIIPCSLLQGYNIVPPLVGDPALGAGTGEACPVK